MVTREAIEERCARVIDPCSAATGSNLDVVEMGLLKSIEILDGDVEIELRLTTPACHMAAYLVEELEHHVGGLDGVDSVDVATDDGTEWSEDMLSEAAKRRRTEVLEEQKRAHLDA